MEDAINNAIVIQFKKLTCTQLMSYMKYIPFLLDSGIEINGRTSTC